MERAVSDRKAFAATHTSDEDDPANLLLPDMSRLSSPKTRLRHGRRHARLSLLNQTPNLWILSFILSLALPPHLSPP